MNITTVTLLIVIVFLCVVIGILFYLCVHKPSMSPEQRLRFLTDVAGIASLSIEHRHTSEHPQRKKELTVHLTNEMIKELDYDGKEHFTLDALIDRSMLSIDTDPRLHAVRVAGAQTSQITPPPGMWQLGVRQKAAQKTGVLG